MNEKNTLGAKLGKLVSSILVIMVTICLLCAALGLAACVLAAIAKVTAVALQWLVF